MCLLSSLWTAPLANSLCKQEANHKLGLGETPRRFIQKTLPILLTREIWRHLWHYIRLNANNAVECGIFDRFSNFDKWRPEAAGDVISDMFVRQIILDKIVSFVIMLESIARNSTQSNRRRYFRQFLWYNFRPEVNNDVISGMVIDFVGVEVRV